MSTITALKLAGPESSLPIEDFQFGIQIWAYLIDGRRYGYYVATQKMLIKDVMNCGCPYPKLDSKERITSFNDARLFAQDRVNWVKKFIQQSNKDTHNVTVLNGTIAVG